MSRADELLAQYETKIAKTGQWIAIRRYSGVSGVRTYADTLAKAYINYKPAQEFVGSVIQNYATVITLAETLAGLVPQINNNDRLVTAFAGFDNLSVPPPLDTNSHVSGGKESAIVAPMKRAPCGQTIAYELHVAG